MCRKVENRATLATVLSTIATGVVAAALTLATTGVSPPTQPGSWTQVGKAATSRVDVRLHVSRTAQNMKALAFVVTSKSPRKIRVVWASYCEFNSDDDYTESYNGRLSGVGRITYYPHLFDGATQCDVSVNTEPIKGARASIAVFAY